jgi:alpha-1,2-mannosyltransferase
MSIAAPALTGAGDRARRLARFAGAGMLVVAAVALTAMLLWRTAEGHGLTQLTDFRIFRAAGQQVMHGSSPYPPPLVEAMRGQSVFVYPAPAAVLFGVLAVAPFTLSWLIWLVAMGAAMLLALRLAGVTDARVAACWFLAPAMAQTFVIGSLAPLLALCAVLVWRYRDRTWVAASALSLAICLKLLLLPLVLWLLITRRLRAAAATVLLTSAACAIGWALIGFQGLSDYPRLLSALSQIEQSIGFSTLALGLALGLPSSAAQAMVAAVCAALCLLAWRRASAGDERGSFCLLLVTGLVVSPIVWAHYLAIVAVAIAFYRPRLSPLWLMPLIFWAVPHMLPRGNLVWLLLWHAMLVLTLLPAVGVAVPAFSAPWGGRARHRPA